MIINAAHGPIMGEYAKQAKDDYSMQNQKQQWSANIHGMIWGDGGNQGDMSVPPPPVPVHPNSAPGTPPLWDDGGDWVFPEDPWMLDFRMSIFIPGILMYAIT